jgi:hypothetical protein
MQSFNELQEQAKLEGVTYDELCKRQGIIRLDPDTTTFTTKSGKTYTVLPTLPSITRQKQLNIFEVELGLGYTVEEIIERLKEMAAAQNSQKFFDVSVGIYELLNRIRSIGKRENIIYDICTLFMVYDGEEKEKYDKVIMDQKIQDWNDSLIDPFFFYIHGVNVSSSIKNCFLNSILKDGPSE